MKPRKWSIQEQAHFLKRTGELLERGYPISEAIESIALHLPAHRKGELYVCTTLLKKGHPFHDLLETLGFQKDLIGYVYFAEQHGSFAEAMLDASELALLKGKDLQKLIKMLQYPTLLMMITGFLFFFVKTTLLPRFTLLFNTMNLQENVFSDIIYGFDRYLPVAFFILLTITLFAAIYYLLIFRRISIMEQRAQLVRIPIVGRILKLLFTHYFSTQLSFLLSGGISVSEALLLFERNNKQPFYSALGKEIKAKLVTGEKLDTILADFPFFEKEFPMIIKHGQENGKLEQELLFFSRHCVSGIEELLDKVLKTIQPIMYLFIGILVISMYLAILLPMFHLLDGL